MQLNSLGFRTDLIFARFQGIVEDCGDVIRIVNPDNPTHYFGNFLIFERPPQPGDVGPWTRRFAELVGTPPGTRHILLGWDVPPRGEAHLHPFLDAGYRLEENVVMSAAGLHAPQRPNLTAELRVIPDTDGAWQALVDNQVACREEDSGESEAAYRTFKEGQFRRYRAMVQSGLGFWYGAFVGGELAADLGVYTDGQLLRFQSVGTHPAYRRQGLCGTLVHFAGDHAQRTLCSGPLVIVADDHYFAKDIYAGVGFEVTERQQLLLRRPEAAEANPA
ncbi:MAG: putative acetyltransferase [Deinococcus sp.]|nr:putative acetyltransferase [Deinococcus sp.]